MNDIPQLINGKRLSRRLTIDRKTLSRWVKRGKFPKPVAPNLWRLDEVIAWFENTSGQTRTNEDNADTAQSI